MKCEEVRTALSEYIDGGMDTPLHQRLTEHIASCRECAQEEQNLARTLSVIRALPRREPVMDLWTEFAPKMAEVLAEERMKPMPRMNLRFRRFMSNFALGAILFTQALAMRTTERLQKYLMADALTLPDGVALASRAQQREVA